MARCSGKRTTASSPSHKDSPKQRGEFSENAIITSDALLTPKKTNCLTFQLGGENLSAIKKNQGNYHQYAENLLEDRGSPNDAFDYFPQW